MWAFCTSPYGLQLTTPQFWDLMPVEFVALRKQWESHRQHSLDLYAGLQTTLHNSSIGFKREGGGRWTPSDFLGRPKPKVPLVQRKGEILEMLRTAATINKKGA